MCRPWRSAPLVLILVLVPRMMRCAFIIPVTFEPQIKAVGGNDAVLYELYVNSSLLGVFIAGLQFGTPPQNIPLLIDTGSSVTHIAGIGCGSSCGVGLPNTIGYNLSASSTGQRVPCGDSCLCSGLCSCDVSSNSHGCAYTISYLDSSSSSGPVVIDHVHLAGNSSDNATGVKLMFGVEAQQTGQLQSMGTAGVLALNRSPRCARLQRLIPDSSDLGAGPLLVTYSSFVGQLLASNSSVQASFGTCWQLDDGTTNASSYLLLGAPQQLLAQLSPSWTPLMSNLSQHWIIGLQSMTVAGPNSTTLNATELGGNLTGTAGSYNRGGGQSNMGAPAMMDSGTTYTLVPPRAMPAIQAAITAAVAARNASITLVSTRNTAFCWSGLPAGALYNNTGALNAAFPEIKFTFSGNASFVATPEGYLYVPTAGSAGTVCLSIFAGSIPQYIFGNRIRQRTLTLHDAVGQRIGFATVGGNCSEVSSAWAAAS